MRKCGIFLGVKIDKSFMSKELKFFIFFTNSKIVSAQYVRFLIVSRESGEFIRGLRRLRGFKKELKEKRKRWLKDKFSHRLTQINTDLK